VKKHAQPVVLEGSKAIPGSLHLLHAQVHRFGRAVRGARVVMDVCVEAVPVAAEQATIVAVTVNGAYGIGDLLSGATRSISSLPAE